MKGQHASLYQWKIQDADVYKELTTRKYLKAWKGVVYQIKRNRHIVEKIQSTRRKENVSKAINKLKAEAIKSLRKKYAENCEELTKIRVIMT